MTSLNRSVVGLLCFATVLALSGCGGGGGESAPEAPADVPDASEEATTRPAEQTDARSDTLPTKAPSTLASIAPQSTPNPGVKELGLATAQPDRTKPGPPSPDPVEFIVKVEPAELDLGTVAVNEYVEGTVQLVNTGDKPMRIVDCRSSCGCTTTKCPKGQELQPGESAEVNIRMRGNAGSTADPQRQNKTVTFIVEGQSALRLPVSAEVITYLAIEPRMISPDASPDGRILIRAMDDQPFRVLSMSPPIIEEFGEDPGVEHELFVSWDRWRELGESKRLSFVVDHVKVKQAQVFVRSLPNRSTVQAQRQGEVAKAVPGARELDAVLAVAIKRGDVEAITKTLDKGADADARNAMLGVAARYGQAEIIQVLLKAGADVEAKDGRGRTPLIAAVQSRNSQALQALLASGADVNARGGAREMPALSWASGLFGDVSVVQTLLAAGAKVDARDKTGMTPILWAVRFGDAARVAALIDAGAAVSTRDDRGLTPLDYARTRRDAKATDIIQILEPLTDREADASKPQGE